MATDGIRIYVGPEATVHAVDQFVPLAAVKHVDPEIRGRLAALNMLVAAHPVDGSASMDPKSGASAACPASTDEASQEP